MGSIGLVTKTPHWYSITNPAIVMFSRTAFVWSSGWRYLPEDRTPHPFQQWFLTRRATLPSLHFRHVQDTTSQSVGCIFQFSFCPENATPEFVISISTRRNMILMTPGFLAQLYHNIGKPTTVAGGSGERTTVWSTFLASSSSPRRRSNWAWTAQWSMESCATETKDLDRFRELWSRR